MLNQQEYAASYFDFMSKVNDNGHILNISTITLIGYLSKEKIDLEKLVQSLESQNFYTIKVGNKKETTVTKRGKIKKSFFNQITLNYKDISKKSIKIFTNGRIHITGLTSYIECNKVSQDVVDVINSILEENIEIVRLKIGMINSNFSCNSNLHLKELNRLLGKEYMCRYSPESYPAINLKYSGSVSIFIFGSGNIVITGSKNIEDLIESYEFINEFINENKDVKLSVNRKINKNTTYFEGYPIRQYISCLK